MKNQNKKMKPVRTLIELENVSKSYGSKPAVRNLTLAVRAGEVFTFLGPNGAGKTTSIKMLAGLLRADRGTIRIDGLNIDHRGVAARARIAYVPDHPFVYEKLTGREFIGFVGRMHGLTQTELREAMDYWIHRFDMEDYADELTSDYSHGMKQKTVLASTLLYRPRVLLVDEPMVGLDPRMNRLVRDVFRELAAGGAALFVSTHTLDVAEEIADRIGIIHHGQLISEGPLDDLRRHNGSKQSLEEMFLQLTDEAQRN